MAMMTLSFLRSHMFLGSLVLAFGACVAPDKSAAHPHVWVTVETEVEVSDTKDITGFRHRWTFDEFYTAFAVQGLDTDGDGKYSREELEPLAKVNMDSLREFEFFTFAKLSGEAVALKEPVNYWLEFKDSLLTLHFTLPLNAPVKEAQAKNFSFAVYDPVFYVAFSFADKTPVRLAGRAALPCQPLVADRAGRMEIPLGGTFGEGFDPSENIGQSFSQTVTLSCPS